SATEAADMLPLLDVGDVLATGWLPGDGFLRPEALTHALAEGARALGVEFATGVRVTGVTIAGGSVTGLETSHGPIRTEVVVNAAGAAASFVGRLAGVVIPIVPIKHQYVVSDPVPGDRDLDAMP